MAASAWFSLAVPTLVAVLSLGLLGAAWAVRLPSLALLFLGVSVVVGQTWRGVLPGQGGGVLLSDGATVLVLLSVLFRLWLCKYSSRLRRDTPPTPYPLHPTPYTLLLLFLPLMAWSVFTLVIQAPRFEESAIAIAGAYWLRLALTLCLIPALAWLLSTDGVLRRRVAWGLFVVVVLLAGLGLGQMVALPHLGVLPGGWDPHEGRLVSTWLDPNFMGGLLAVAAPWLCAQAVTSGRGWRWVTGSGVVVALTALLLTRSRGSLLALGVGLLVLSPLYIRQWRPQWPLLASVLLLVVVVGVGGVWLLGERATGLLLQDETVELRLQSLVQAWELVRHHPWLGVGYNFYQFAAQEAGSNQDFTIHSRAGADVSLLTIWVTTGVIGVGLWLLPWVWLGTRLIGMAMQGTRHSWLPLTVATSLLTWFVHGLFVNSWLYAHLLIVVAVLVGLGSVTPAVKRIRV